MIKRITNIFRRSQAESHALGKQLRPQSSKRFKRCVIHIGTEKTGTSSIQRFLTTNRQELCSKAILYPSLTGKNGGSQWGFVGCVQKNVWKSDIGRVLGIASQEQQEAYRKKFLAELEGEFALCQNAETLIISSEHFHSRLQDVASIEALKAMLDQWVEDYEIVMYLRRQDSVAVSLYSTKVKSGNANPILFPYLPNKTPQYYFDYESVYNNWRAAFGADSIHVRLFGREELQGGDLLHDFCATTGLPIDGMELPKVENAGVNKAGMDFLLELNRQCPRAIGVQDNAKIADLVAYVAKTHQGKTVLCDRKQAQEFYGIYKDGNERLKQMLFPTRITPLFSEDFSDYPEVLEEEPPRYEEAVAIAVGIWMDRSKND